MKNKDFITGTKISNNNDYGINDLIDASNKIDEVEFYEDGVDYGDARNDSLSKEDFQKVYLALNEMAKKVDNLKDDMPAFEKSTFEKPYKINWIVDAFSLEEVECGIANSLYTRTYIDITPLMFLAKIGKTKALYKQIRKNPTAVNATAVTGKTALMLASTYGNINCVKLLIVAGAYVDYQDYHGATALMLAVNYGQYEVVKILLKNGANKNLVDKNGIGAIQLARENKDIKIIELLAQL